MIFKTDLQNIAYIFPLGLAFILVSKQIKLYLARDRPIQHDGFYPEGPFIGYATIPLFVLSNICVHLLTCICGTGLTFIKTFSSPCVREKTVTRQNNISLIITLIDPYHFVSSSDKDCNSSRVQTLLDNQHSVLCSSKADFLHQTSFTKLLCCQLGKPRNNSSTSRDSNKLERECLA